jgi:hypothetical protein
MEWLFIVTFVTATTAQQAPNEMKVQATSQEIGMRVASKERCSELMQQWQKKSFIGGQSIVEKRCTIAPKDIPVKAGKFV